MVPLNLSGKCVSQLEVLQIVTSSAVGSPSKGHGIRRPSFAHPEAITNVEVFQMELVGGRQQSLKIDGICLIFHHDLTNCLIVMLSIF